MSMVPAGPIHGSCYGFAVRLVGSVPCVTRGFAAISERACNRELVRIPHLKRSLKRLTKGSRQIEYVGYATHLMNL